MKFDFENVIHADHKIMRLINRANVINIIREQAPISRVEISRLTGLKKSTISSIVGELINVRSEKRKWAEVKSQL